MKKTLRYLCAVVFLAICVGLIAFMREFTVAGPAAYYADWITSEIVTAGGAVSFDQYAGQPEISDGEYLRFTASLPEGRGDGSYLLIETTGGNVRLIVDGNTVFSSYTAPSEAVNLATVNLPLPAGGGETLVLKVEPEEELGIFPPLLRLTTDPTDSLGNIAYANYYSFPAGAFALATAIICGLFLLELSEGRFQWKLLPLLAASIGLTLNPIAIGYGSAFLPDELYAVLTWSGLPWLIALSALLYLLLHRDKQFWLGLGFAAAVTLAVLLVSWAVSALTGGYLAKYMGSLASELGSGYYGGALTWLTRWLVAVSAFLGVRELVLYLVRTRSESRALALKDELVMQNYRAVEAKLRETARLRHEFSHQLAALYSMWKSGDNEALGHALSDWSEANLRAEATIFTRNIVLNAIVSDASARAEALGIRFDAEVTVSEDTGIRVEDLCTLLMNMLDNAIEAASKVEDGYIKLRINERGGFLAVSCENSFDGRVVLDDSGRCLSTKSDAEGHGFGLTQMSAAAAKYGSIIDVGWTGSVFSVQTALRLRKGQ